LLAQALQCALAQKIGIALALLRELHNCLGDDFVDVVTTLGSVGERPYVPGIPVGTVATVHLGVGRLAPTGTVTPAVDTTSLDVVAVVLGPGRSTPRPAATGTG